MNQWINQSSLTKSKHWPSARTMIWTAAQTKQQQQESSSNWRDFLLLLTLSSDQRKVLITICYYRSQQLQLIPSISVQKKGKNKKLVVTVEKHRWLNPPKCHHFISEWLKTAVNSDAFSGEVNFDAAGLLLWIETLHMARRRKLAPTTFRLFRLRHWGNNFCLWQPDMFWFFLFRSCQRSCAEVKLLENIKMRNSSCTWTRNRRIFMTQWHRHAAVMLAALFANWTAILCTRSSARNIQQLAPGSWITSQFKQILGSCWM